MAEAENDAAGWASVATSTHGAEIETGAYPLVRLLRKSRPPLRYYSLEIWGFAHRSSLLGYSQVVTQRSIDDGTALGVAGNTAEFSSPVRLVRFQSSVFLQRKANIQP